MATQMFKIKKIKEAIKDGNVEELRTLAVKHGFVNHMLRKKVWPMLLGFKAPKRSKRKVSSSKLPRRMPCMVSNCSNESNASSCSNKSNYDQIEKDVARSALNFYNVKETQEQSRSSLGRILHDMFDESEDMHYIQGFNDVVSVFYAVCGSAELTSKLSNRVAKTLLKDYIMNGTLELNFTAVQLIFKLISFEDQSLHNLFTSINAHLYSFCVSWLLTWFAHEIKDISSIARIYDYCLCSHESISLYMSGALLIYFRKHLLDCVVDDVTLHCFFQELDWNKVDFNKVIAISETLFKKYPPTKLCPVSYSATSIVALLAADDSDDDMSEIKEELATGDSSSCELSSDDCVSDAYTPSLGHSDNITPLSSCPSDDAFNIEEHAATSTVAVAVDASIADTKTAQMAKPKAKAKPKLSTKFDNFLEAFHTFEDKLERTIDDFVAIFDTKALEQTRTLPPAINCKNI